MKINRYQPIQSYQSYQTARNTQKAAQSADSANKSDKIEISDEAKRMQSTQAFAEARSQKVESIKKQVQDGTYQVSAEDVAKKLYDYWNKR